MPQEQTPNERFVEIFNQLNYSIPEFAAECELKSQIRTLYKVINDGHKPSPKLLRAIESKFPQFDIRYIYHNKRTNAVEEKSKENFNNTTFTQQEKIMIEQNESFNEMKETLNKTVLMQSEMMNRFLMKFQDMETSNIRLRGEVMDLMKGVEGIKTNQHNMMPVVMEHISLFNEFKETILPEIKLGESIKVKKKH